MAMIRLRRILAWIALQVGVVGGARKLANAFEAKRRTNGRPPFPFLKRRVSRCVQILVYHRINDDKDPFFPGTPISVFSKQMEYIAANYTVCSLDDVVARMPAGDIPDNAMAVTFDDGYKDNLVNAFPILRQFRIPATIFLATDSVGSGRTLWHDKVFAAFRRTEVSVMAGLESYGIKPHSLKTIGEKVSALQDVLSVLRRADEWQRLKVIELLMAILNVAVQDTVEELMLTWEDVKAMHDCGVAFGSHTVTHPILAAVSLDRSRTEIVESKRQIETYLGTPVRTFAYPNGKREDFNEAVKNMLKDAGYSCAVTTLAGTNAQGRDLFELRRATPWEEDVGAFGLRLSYYRLIN